ncbi:MAG: FAD-dependent monooxygenase, partial [Bacteroidota bacterium]
MYTIIGGGIGGLTTALAFEQNGIPYQLYEQATAFESVGAGIWMAPNALQVLQKLGVYEQVLSQGNSLNQIQITDARFRPISTNDLSPVAEEFGCTTIAIHRARLQEILLKQLPSESIHTGHTLSEIQKQAEKYQLHFSNGKVVESAYLIGADGIHSKVRKFLFPIAKQRYSGQTCWRGVATFSLPTVYQSTGLEAWGGRLRFGFSQIAEEAVYWYAVSKQPAGGQDDPSILQNQLLNAYGDFHPMVGQLIRSTDRQLIKRNDLYDLQAIPKWYKDNALLIGDAGHAATPNLGQGGAQAIEDAYFLAQVINSGADHPFAVFQNKRQRKVKSVVQQSWQTGQMAHWTSFKGVRNFALRQMPASVML